MSRSKHRSHWSRLVGALISSAIFAALAAGAHAARKHQSATATWTRVDAVITRSELVEDSRDLEHGPTYTLDLAYRYSHNGQPYEGTKIRRFDMGSNNLELWERRSRKFASGATVTAWVNPDQPSEAVLEPGQGRIEDYLAWATAVCIALIALGWAPFVFGVLRRERTHFG